MIEFIALNSVSGVWHTLRHYERLPLRSDFNTVIYKINGTIYEEWNDEFEKAVIWSQLKHD